MFLPKYFDIDLYHPSTQWPYIVQASDLLTFRFVWHEDNESAECHVRATSLNEAIGAFLVEYSHLSYDDILEHEQIT